MASIVLLLSELLGGESASVLAAERYMGGHRSLLGDFRPAVTEAPAAKLGQRPMEGQHAAAAGTARVREVEDRKRKDDSFEDLAVAVSRIAVDGIMWP